jgi:hypothetical protein
MAIFSSFEELEIEGETNGTIVLREEQKEAIKRAAEHFKSESAHRKFLWNAKMRFGKTICAMHLAKQMGVKTCLIVTHRPVVNQSWREDFQKTFGDDSDYKYGTLSQNQHEGDFYQLESFANQEGKHLVFFVSMQYLCLSPEVNTNTGRRAADNDNNRLKAAILKKEWGLVVIDEAHEGTRTALGLRVIDMLSKPKTKVLHLSGTPFNLYQDFGPGEIYTWDYIKEQRAKQVCNSDSWKAANPGKRNPYAGLPRMNIFTYDLAELLTDYSDKYQSFKFSEFFRVWNEQHHRGQIPEGKAGRFVHEDHVNNFLNLLCQVDDHSGYPFSTEEYRNNFRHTLWVVPGVKEARALEQLLHDHPIFQNFTIKNVAGNSEDDETRANALDTVLAAIGPDPTQDYTITISCGRLTTGVTVPPWTAVLYLKGSDNTAASTYLQTIFRVQSPWDFTHEGKRWMKKECFVFDFAPNRTLQMMAETAKFSVDTEDEEEKNKKQKKGKRPSTKDDREKMKEFLNFCPVVSMEGGEMKPYNVDSLFAQLDRVYVDRVVRNGFNDNNLYNEKELLKLDPDALNRLHDIISKTTNLDKPKKANTIDLTANPSNPAQTTAEHEAGGSSETTPEEDAQKKAEREFKKKQREERDNRITILRGISLRIPLLIYGAELIDESAGITIDNFTTIVDDASWAEFMPKGISKEDFNSFKIAYEPTVFVDSGKRIRALAREADDMPADLRIQRIAEIFSWFHNPDKETVLTPWRVVNMHMSDCIGGYCFFNEKFDGPNQKELVDETTNESKIVDAYEPRFVSRGKVTTDIFEDYDSQTKSYNSRILEINSKTGLYPLYVAYTLYRFRREHYMEANLIKNLESLSIKDEQVIWDDIIRDNIFVICNTPMAKAITKRTLLGFRETKFEPNIKFEKLVEQVVNNKAELVEKIKTQGFWKGDENNNMIKFSAVVGNPPYQIMDGGTDRGAVPVYQNFFEVAKSLNPSFISMIMPARWYAGGRGLDNFRNSMLNDNRLEHLYDFELTNTIFPTVNIAGGICYFSWNSKHEGECMVHNPESIQMKQCLRKLNDFEVFVRNNAAISILLKIREKTDNFLNDVVLSINPFGFRTYYRGRKDKQEGDIRILTSEGWGYVNRSEVCKSIDLIDSYKIIVGRFVPSNGEMNVKPGEGYRVITSPKILGPQEINTETYIDAATWRTSEEATNYSTYLHCKFTRFLLRQAVTSVNVTRECFAFAPLQDFTSNSDINWQKPICDIDKQLFKKYGLTVEEQDYIECMIKPMDVVNA